MSTSTGWHSLFADERENAVPAGNNMEVYRSTQPSILSGMVKWVPAFGA